ncbi:MAG: RNA polymerase sigma factor [Clostridia bacterium]|jgi:RNA polymerase sigma-70 factor (ECF subfamily)|nr:RNA polymerase sigma factor [Clostridia bacterium]
MISNHSFETLFDLYYEKVYRSTYLIIQNEGIAQDATQEAFIEAFKNLDKLRNKEKFPAWVAVIASNKAIDILRKNRKLFLVHNIDDFIPNISPLTPDVVLIKKETSDELVLQLKQLSVIYREVIVLRYFHNLQDSEIATILNLPLGTVKSRLHRAKIILRKKMSTL